jgi:hypothetical protein
MHPDGSKATTDYLYRLMAGTSGFAGDWESTTKPVGLKLELEIQPYDKKGLTFVSAGPNRNVTFDGREHAVATSKDDQTLSGKRLGARALEYTEKNRGKLERVRRLELSRDGHALIETLRAAGQVTPDVFFFERE